MYIDKIKLTNFRGINQLEIPLNKQLNIFCGINGIGKSTVLDAIVLHLSWLILKVKQSKGSAKPISLTDINNSSKYSMAEISYSYKNMKYKASLLKSMRGGNPIGSKTDFSEISKLGNDIIKQDQLKSLPVFISYSNKRVVNDVTLKPKKNRSFDIFETYDNSLNYSTSFSNFFEWFRSREDLDNENYRASSGHTDLAVIHKQYIGDIQLKAVKTAIKEFTGFNEISIRRNPLHMQIVKNDEKLRLEQLSDGEKCLVALVGDIARRLSIANPNSNKPLEGNGIVVIDEIDLHLHPGWQKSVINKLLKIFPNIQFILSTHSPLILSEIRGSDIFALHKEENKVKFYKPKQALGLYTNDILEVLMDTGSINSTVRSKIDEIFELIDEEEFTKAKKLISDFIHVYKETPDIIRAQSLLTMYSDEE